MAVLGALRPRLVGLSERYLSVPDALGLALFSLTGAGYAIEAGTSMLIAVILGMITGTFGSVIAEVISNEIPSLFRSAPLNATCSFTGAWVYLLLGAAGLAENWALLAGFVTIAGMRLAALRWDIRLPNAAADRTPRGLAGREGKADDSGREPLSRRVGHSE
jgi:uncharacterized membrane protein YeiH